LVCGLFLPLERTSGVAGTARARGVACRATTSDDGRSTGAPRIIGEKIRSFLVRGLAVITVVLTYALGNEETQGLSVAGISAVRVTVTAAPAYAWRRFRHRRILAMAFTIARIERRQARIIPGAMTLGPSATMCWTRDLACRYEARRNRVGTGSEPNK